MHHGSPHVEADGVHAGEMASAQRLIELIARRRVDQRFVEAGLFEGLSCAVEEIVVFSLHVVMATERAIERLELLRAVALFEGDHHANRSPRLAHHVAVFLGKIAAIVEHGQTHGVKTYVDVSNPLSLEEPA